MAANERSYDKGQFILEPAHYLALLKIKPGSLDNSRAFNRAIGASGSCALAVKIE